MRLIRPTGPPARRAVAKPGRRSPTAEPGFTNAHRQVVERATGAASARREHQTVYALRCRDCNFLYGCNGLDIKDRCCPQCQGGIVGEPLQVRHQADHLELFRTPLDLFPGDSDE